MNRLLCVLLLLAGAGALPSAAHAAALSRCGSAPAGVKTLRESGTSCHAARLVARAWVKSSGDEQNCDTRAEDCEVFGYTCAMSESGFADTRVRCTRGGGRRITFVGTA